MNKPRRTTVIAVYGAAAALGYLVGVKGLPPFGLASPSAATSRLRVGWVLTQPPTQAPADAWTSLAVDVAAASVGWPPLVRQVFELVGATRGLKTGGKPDWAEAQQLCRGLNWSHCDQAALEQVRARGVP